MKTVNRFRGRFKMFEATTDERNVRAGFGQRSRDAAGDAGTAAGDEGDVAIKDSFSEDFHKCDAYHLAYGYR